MLITTVSAPVQADQAKGTDHETSPEQQLGNVHNTAGIIRECTIEQKIERIPEELLTRPSDNETWRRYFVLVRQLEHMLPCLEEVLSIHIAGTTLDDQYYDVVIYESCVQYLHRIGCAFELASEDDSVNAGSTESTDSDGFLHIKSTEADDYNEFVHVESTEADDYNEFVHVESTESDDFNEFVLLGQTESTDTNLSAQSAEPIKPVNYKNLVSVNVVFVEFDRLKFDLGLGSGGTMSDETVESSKKLHYDVSQPKQAEIDVCGIYEAKKRAEDRFVMNAMRAVSSVKHGQGLDRYYISSLDYHNACGLSLVIRWAVLLRDIKSSEQDVMRQFFRHCLFVTLHTLDDPDMACNFKFARWTDVEWLQFFEKVSFARWQSRSTEEKMLVLSLLQVVFASARDGKGPRLGAFKGEFSDQGNLEKLGSLFFHVSKLEAVPFGGLERTVLERCLRQFKILEDCDELDVRRLIERMNNFLPFWEMRRGSLAW